MWWLRMPPIRLTICRCLHVRQMLQNSGLTMGVRALRWHLGWSLLCHLPLLWTSWWLLLLGILDIAEIEDGILVMSQDGCLDFHESVRDEVSLR